MSGRSRPTSSALGGATLTTTSALVDGRRVAGERGPRVLVLGVRDQRGRAGITLDDDLVTVAGQLLHDLGDECDATLAVQGFLRNSDLHGRWRLSNY